MTHTYALHPGQLVLVLALVGAGIWTLAHSARSEEAKEGATNVDTLKACATACGLPDSDEELRKLLTPEQYRIMKENGTEYPFQNEYWNNHAEGLYVDRISGVPLFTSMDKFESGTGWPSFTKPVAKNAVKELSDGSAGMVRTEVRSSSSDSHLGHVFNDGPQPTGLRYCMNSASLLFIPTKDLQDTGYGAFLPLFGKTMREPGTQPMAIPGVSELATFGGGCFWGVEGFFREVPGVLATAVGYEGGITENPSYKEICGHGTQHAEVVELSYDPNTVDYQTLLKTFFEYHDPTTLNQQGPDVGDQYRSVIFTHSPEQAAIAEQYIAELTRRGVFKNPIVTQVLPAETFWRGEDYHQQYFQKNNMPSCHLPQRSL